MQCSQNLKIVYPINAKFSKPQKKYIPSMHSSQNLKNSITISSMQCSQNLKIVHVNKLWCYCYAVRLSPLYCIHEILSFDLVLYRFNQGDHNWTMKNMEVLSDMRATEETMVIFSNSLDPNETPCDTASHCDPCCLTINNNGFREFFKTGKIRRSPDKSGEMVGLV